MQGSLSPATGSGEAAAHIQPSCQIDLDKQVVRLVQQKIEEMLPPPQFTGKPRLHDSDDESEWEDLSDQPESSDDSETEVFVVPKTRKHKKMADSSDGDAYARTHKKASLVKKTKNKKAKKSKHRSSSSNSSSASTTT